MLGTGSSWFRAARRIAKHTVTPRLMRGFSAEKPRGKENTTMVGEPKRILVTGGAGFIGSALVRRLVAEGHEVSALDDLSRGRWDRLDGIDVKLYPVDIRDCHPNAPI